MGSPSVSGDVPRRNLSDAASSDAARRLAPRTNAEGRQLGQSFLAQLTASSSSMAADLGSDDSTGGASADSGGDDSSVGAPDTGIYSMLPAATALQQGRQGTNRSMAALMSMISGGEQATGGAEQLASLASTAASSTGAAGAATTTPALGGPTSSSAQANATIVADVARQKGVDPRMAVAMMLVESGGNERSVGDQGTSFGLFQLHQGGMLTAAGLTPSQALDPRTNAGVALASLASYAKGRPHATPGEIAAASQRPADPTGYAQRVNAMLAKADALLARI